MALGNNGTLIVNGTDRGNISQGSITSTSGGNVTFSGSGTTYYLYGTQGYAGTTTVTAGTVRVDANMSSGAFALNGGTLETIGANRISDTASVTLGGGTLQIGGSEAFGNNGVTLTSSTASTVSVNSGVTASVSGTVTGGGNLSKSDTGQLNLSGNNNYSGTTTVSGGMLEAQSANALGSTAAGTTVSSGAQLKLWNSTGGIIYGAEALNLNGAGVNSEGALRNVSGDNIWTGAITLQSNSRIHSSAGTLTLDVASGSAITGTFQLNIGGAGNVTVNDNISIGTQKLVKDGAGILTLGASNNYSGNTEVDAGEIQFATGGSANSSRIWVGNGGSMATTAKVWIQSSGTTISSAIDVNNGNANTRVLGGLNATGTATYSGAIGVNNGDLNLEANNAGGTVEFTGAVTTTTGKYVTASGPGLVILSGSGNNTGLGANVNSGTLRLAKTSSGSVRALNATPIVNNGGTLQFGGSGGDQLPDNVSVNINTGGRLDMNGVNETIGGFTLNGTGIGGTGAIINSSSTAARLTLGGQANLASDSFIGGTGDITIDGNQRIVSSVVGTGRTLTKVGANTVTLANGTTSQDNTDLFVAVTAGKLVLAKASADGNHAAGGFTVNSGGTLQLGGSGGFQIWKGATTATVNPGGTFDLNGQNQTFTGTGPTISGVGVSSAGALINSSTAAVSTLSSAVVLAGDSSVGGTGNLTISGIISQSGGNRALTKVGTGTLTVSQNNSFAGNATINEGKVTMSHANGLGLGAITVNAGADLEVTGGITVTRNLTLSAKNGQIRGGRLMSSGTNQKNTYSGTIAVNNSEFDVASGNTLDVTGKISGSGTVTKTGAGELQLSNTGNDYSGITDIQNGTLTAAAIADSGTASSIGTANEVKLGSSANPGTFKYTGGTAGMNRTITVGSNGGSINVDNSTTTMTLTGTVAGSGATLTKTGAGKLALGSGSSATVGTIAIQHGTLLLGAADRIGDTTAITMSGGTLDTAGYSDAVGRLSFTGSSVNAAIHALAAGDAGSFVFSDLDTSSFGNLNTLTFSGVTNAGDLSGAFRIQLSSGVLSSGDLTSLNTFTSKVSFGTGVQTGAISFTSGTGGTYLTVAAIPDARVYSAAAFLLVLIGATELKRRRKRAQRA